MGRMTDRPYDLSIYKVKICASLRRNELLHLTIFEKQTDIGSGHNLICLTNKTTKEEEKEQDLIIIQNFFNEVTSRIITPNVAPYEADGIPSINTRLLLTASNYNPIST